MVRTVFLNFWRFLGNLSEARSRLYRNESLQVNTRWNEVSYRETEKLLTRSTRFTNFYTAPHSKLQLNFVKHFRIFTVSFSSFHSFFAIFVQISPILTMFFQKIRKFAGEDQNLLDSQVS